MMSLRGCAVSPEKNPWAISEPLIPWRLASCRWCSADLHVWRSSITRPTSAMKARFNLAGRRTRMTLKANLSVLNNRRIFLSAKKIAGIPAHRLARKGQPVELKAKQVEIKELGFYDCDGQTVSFRAWVSSGTYLRSLAHDLGKKLGPGGHLAALKRTAVREFTIDEAHSLEQLEQSRAAGT